VAAPAIRHLRKSGEGPLIALDRVDLDGTAGHPGWDWLVVTEPDPGLVRSLAERYGWDRLAVEDVLEDAPLPKFADYENHLFVVLHGLGPPTERLTSVELNAFLSQRLLVTIAHHPIPVLEEVVASALEIPGAAEGGPDRMLARVSAALVGPYLPLIDALDHRIGDLEDRALSGDPSVIVEVQALRRDVTRLRRFAAPQREVVLALAREEASTLVTRRARLRFDDVYEQLYRTVESLDGSRLMLGSILETYRSAVAEDMNGVMKVLTAFSAILLPLSLLAGIWGMNFAHMPELDRPWGYAAALGTMGLVGAGLWLYFSRRGFIGGPRLRDLPKAVGLGLLQLVALPIRGIGAVVHSVTDERPGRE
jgi:magnesium transporter